MRRRSGSELVIKFTLSRVNFLRRISSLLKNSKHLSADEKRFLEALNEDREQLSASAANSPWSKKLKSYR